MLVEGGPGTGKSVIALDALGHAIRKKQTTYLVSGSAAFTHGMRRLLGPELAPLVRFTDFFWNHPENSVDVLIVDEAHRIRTKSQPKVVAARRPKISQLEELVRAAKVTVLFMDENQIIQPDENGNPQQVVDLAANLGIKVIPHHLRAQFRCDGSNDYLWWVDALFDLSSTEGRRPLRSPEAFDLDIMDSPHEVLTWVREKNAAQPNSARLTAGWCWPWSDPRPDRSLVNDIVIGDFTFPWELKNNKRGKPGIPQAKHWAVDPAGADQAGTVYSVQGFEFGHVGVLMGPDLVICGGKWVANPRANRAPALCAKPPEVASIYLRRIYRALFTRPLRSLRVFSVDAETREFLRSQLDVKVGRREKVVSTPGTVLSFRRVEGKDAKPFQNCVPLYRTLKAAAGALSPEQMVDGIPESGPIDVERYEWALPTGRTRPQPGLFLAQVVGESMNRRISNGAWCLWRLHPKGSRQGKVVIAEHRDIVDADQGGQFTVKLYSSEKSAIGEDQWEHSRVVLLPDSTEPTFEPIVFEGVLAGELRILAELVEVLGPGASEG